MGVIPPESWHGFRVGDKVRIVQKWPGEPHLDSYCHGQIGTITELDDDSRPYKVHLDDGDYEWVNRVEHVDRKWVTTISGSTFTNISVEQREAFSALSKAGILIDWEK